MTEAIIEEQTELTPKQNSFSHEEIARYSRHLIIPEVGVEGQAKLKKARVLIIGAGGLGSPISMYLAAAGVGTIGIVDYDVVDYSNLQRQIIHGTEDVGRSKIDSAKDTIVSINPLINVIKHEELLNSTNAIEIIKKYDIIVDGTDNFPTRYLVNDACVLLKKPNVYGSIFRFEGQISVFYPGKGPCYRCLYSEPPPPGLVPSCAEGGVFGVLPGIVGTIQATEIIKLILGKGESLIGRLLLFDALDMQFKELKLQKNPNCAICGNNPTIQQLIDYEAFCGIGPDQEIYDTLLTPEDVISAKQLQDYQKSKIPFKLIDVREPHEQQISKIEGSILIPLNEIESKIVQFNKNELIILHCKMGTRSSRALIKLKNLGFTNLKNLAGGINAWANQIDRSIATY